MIVINESYKDMEIEITKKVAVIYAKNNSFL